MSVISSLGYHKLDLPQLALIVASLCYASGFIITNMHLTALGVASVELLRLRYISAGFVFLSFFGLIAASSYFFDQLFYATLRKDTGASWAGVVFYPITLGVSYFFVGEFLNELTGATRRPPVIVSDMLMLPYWLSQVQSSLRWVGLLLFISIAVFMLKWMRAKLGVRLSMTRLGQRRKWKGSGEMPSLKAITRDNFTLFWWSFLITIFGLLVSVASIASSWARFTTTAYAIFLITVLNRLYPYIVKKFGNVEKLRKTFGTPPDEEHPVAKFSLGLLGMTLPAIFAVLIYLRVIYPDIPQQLGGGSIIPVQIVAESGNVPQPLTDPTAQLFLVDRTSSDSIFYVVRRPPLTQPFIEVANSDIKGVIYYPPSGVK